MHHAETANGVTGTAIATDDSARNVLDPLANLAGHSFGSTEELSQAVLRLITRQLPMRSAFLARVTPRAGALDVLAADNRPSGSEIDAGSRVSLPTTF